MIIEPPRSLTKEEFKARIKYLESVGKPITMENIDPKLEEYLKKQSAFYNLSKALDDMGKALWKVVDPVTGWIVDKFKK